MVAVSKGYLVPGPDFAGTVHSVFATACNLAVDGLLLTVHDAAAPHTPTSVRVTGWSPGARAGDPVRCGAGILSFGGHVLDLRALPVWTPPPPVRAWSAITGAEQVAELRERHVAARGIAVPGLDGRAEGLLEALTGRPDDVPGAVARLVGFGPGLTPSGDDLLVGTLAVLSRAAQASSGLDGPTSARAFHSLADGVRRHAHRTTDVGAHYLRLAAEGHFSEPIIGLVDALVSESGRTAVPARTRAALRVGAGSGADGVAGVLLGLRALGFTPDRKAA